MGIQPAVPGCVMWPEATLVNYVYTTTINKHFRPLDNTHRKFSPANHKPAHKKQLWPSHDTDFLPMIYGHLFIN